VGEWEEGEEGERQQEVLAWGIDRFLQYGFGISSYSFGKGKDALVVVLLVFQERHRKAKCLETLDIRRVD
jgi:hypothetical protein